MATAKSTRPHGRSLHSVPSSDRASLLAGINERALLDLVDAQRSKLYNLFALLACVGTALREDDHEALGAVELAAEEVERVLEALDQVNLIREARQATGFCDELRAASEAAREGQS